MTWKPATISAISVVDGIVVVENGGDENYPRPPAPMVYWKGSNSPANANSGDFYFETDQSGNVVSVQVFSSSEQLGPIQTSLPESSNTTVQTSDKGKYLNVSGGVTINTSTSFSSGDAVSIYNNSESSITITGTGVTLRLAGTDTTGDRSLAQSGVATVLCVATNDYVCVGAGLS